MSDYTHNPDGLELIEEYGKEWEKEMMKMTKKQLIDFIRRIKTSKMVKLPRPIMAVTWTETF